MQRIPSSSRARVRPPICQPRVRACGEVEGPHQLGPHKYLRHLPCPFAASTTRDELWRLNDHRFRASKSADPSLRSQPLVSQPKARKMYQFHQSMVDKMPFSALIYRRGIFASPFTIHDSPFTTRQWSQDHAPQSRDGKGIQLYSERNRFLNLF